MRAALGADATVDAARGGSAGAIRAMTGGGAHVSVEALGIAGDHQRLDRCLRPLGRHVQVGMPVGHTPRMEMNMSAVYMKTSRSSAPAACRWRYPSLLALIERGDVDFAPLIARGSPCSDASAELRAFDGPTPPGVAVITDFAH